MKPFLIIFFLICLVVCPQKSFAETIPQLTGKQLLDMIRADKGKLIFLNFFATWCPPCRKEIPEIIALRQQTKTEQLTIIGLSLDSDANALSEFAKKSAFNYPIFQADEQIPAMFGISSIPHNAIFNTQGQLVMSSPGLVEASSLRPFLESMLKEKQKKSK